MYQSSETLKGVMREGVKPFRTNETERIEQQSKNLSTIVQKTTFRTLVR